MLVLGVIGVLWLARGKKAQEAVEVQPSIAVLPFVNMSADRNQEYFSDGLAEELLDTEQALSLGCAPMRPSGTC